MNNNNIDIKLAIDFLCVQASYECSEEISELKKSKYKALAYRFEKMCKYLETIRTLARVLKDGE